MEQGKRKLSETVLVQCTDVRVFRERLLWWNEAWIWHRALQERVSEVFTHSFCKCQPYASSPEPPAYILQNGRGRNTFPRFVCLAAESHHNLQKAWSTLKLKQLPSFVRVADLKAQSETTGIGTHDSRRSKKLDLKTILSDITSRGSAGFLVQRSMVIEQ